MLNAEFGMRKFQKGEESRSGFFESRISPDEFRVPHSALGLLNKQLINIPDRIREDRAR